MPKKLTATEFIAKAKTIHGDKYGYNKSDYVDSKTKVCIICPEHGEFWQTPKIHLKGCGCSKCLKKNSTKKLTQDEFIDRAISVHGDKYDYSKVEYKNNTTKACIICPEHGEFLQTPKAHLRGQGCPICKGGVSDNKESFIKKANIVHNNKYDYSKVNYINTHTPISIICPEHGEFLQVPNSHIAGCGCQICGGHMRLDTETFIERAKAIHGTRYDYSKVKYVDSYTKLSIICNKHGIFEQLPHKHLLGQGCPMCKRSHLESEMSM